MALGPSFMPGSLRSSTSESSAEPDLRLVPPAIGVWGGSVAGVLGPRIAAVTLGVAVLWLLVSMGRRAWTLAGIGLGLAGATLVAGSWQFGLAASVPARWAADGAFMKVQAVVVSDTRYWAGNGQRPDMAITPLQLTRVTARGSSWQGTLPAQLRITGATAAGINPPVGSTVAFEALAHQPDRDEKLVAVLTLRGEIQIVAQPGPLIGFTNRFRDGLTQAMQRSSPEQAGLVPALVVGDTTGLPESIKADFRATGLTHLTAVSGTNLTLMLVFVLTLAKAIGLRGWWLRGLGALVAVLFVIICRAEPSVLRAAAMGLIALAATGLAGDRNRGLRVLSLAGIVLLLTDPWLALAPGFWLSVASCAGILWWAPYWQRLLGGWLPDRLAEAIAIPLAAQLATQPISTALSGTISVVGVFANLLAGPFVGVVTILGMAAALAGLSLPQLAACLGWLAGWCVQPILLIAHLGAELPAANWRWPATVPAVALLTVLGLLSGQWLVPRILVRRWAIGLVGLLLILATWRQPPQPGWPGNWSVVACDVGQGGAQLIRTGQHEAILVDTGPDARSLRQCLASTGVREVPLLVLTHGHADHVGGLAGLAGVPVGILLTGPDTAATSLLSDQPAGLPRATVTNPGDRAQIGAAAWLTLAAGPVTGMMAAQADESSAVNDAGVVGMVQVGDFRVLVTGDIELAGQQALLASGADISADVLVVPHHGSSRLDAAFVAAVGASVALIQVGQDNDYGHPAQRALRILQASGAQVFRTDQQGAIAVSRDGARVITQR